MAWPCGRWKEFGLLEEAFANYASVANTVVAFEPVTMFADPEFAAEARSRCSGEVEVVDRTGGGDHFQVTVASDRFDGLSLIEQHRLVNAALAGPLADGTIHELRIRTKGTA